MIAELKIVKRREVDENIERILDNHTGHALTYAMSRIRRTVGPNREALIAIVTECQDCKSVLGAVGVHHSFLASLPSLLATLYEGEKQMVKFTERPPPEYERE